MKIILMMMELVNVQFVVKNYTQDSWTVIIVIGAETH